MIDRSILTRIIGFPATLIHGDTLVLDRWRWIKKRLPITKKKEKLIDIGCGTGAFTIGAALRGYEALGLSWDERNQRVADERARICKAYSARFEVLDVRKLDTREDFYQQFDIAICCETIEHILDDKKLFEDIASCLKPGGRLLLTTPNLLYRPITSGDDGPFSTKEDGGHVRRGYTQESLETLCTTSRFVAGQITFCSGILSQKITGVMRILSTVHPLFAWIIVLPLRMLPIAFDKPVTSLTGWPYYSICLEAIKT
jgi:SAM-dependent methyltransferase